MKKSVLLFISLCLAIAGIKAQPMAGFDLEVSTPGYTELTGATVVQFPSDLEQVNTAVISGGNVVNTANFTAQGFAIGFDFMYNNQLMNQFVIAPRGYLVLGKDEVTATVHNSNSIYQIFNSNGNDNVLGFIYRSLVVADENSEISYKLAGSNPNRTLTVQFKNMLLRVDNWNGAIDKARVNFQIRLCEGGDVDFFFNDFKPFDGVTMNHNDGTRIGLRGTGNDRVMKASDFNSNSYNFTDNIIQMSATNYPADGTQYHWVAPEECAAPATQASALTLTSTSTGINGTFEATDLADHYLVLMSKQSSLSATPVDGTGYAKGDVIGNATVVQYDTSTAFATDNTLDGATPYYIYVVAANSYCNNGPKYNTTNIPSATINTKPEGPTSIAVTANNLHSLVVNVAGNSTGNDILLAYTEEPYVNDYNQQLASGAFGEPTGMLSEGDEIDGGGVVFYRGAAGSITCEDLEENTLYYIKAWSVDAANNYSSTTVELGDITAGNVTWYDNLSKQSPYDPALGWKQDGKWGCDAKSVNARNFAGNPTDGTETWIETPWIVLGEGTNRLIFSYSSYIWGRFSNAFHQFDNDNIQIQVTTDDENYTTVYTIDKDTWQKPDNADDYMKYVIPFTEAAGEKVKIRFLMKMYSTVYIFLKDIRVEQKKDCDYPINLAVVGALTFGELAGLDWTPQGEEDAWEVRYKKSDDTEWTEPQVAREHPFVITGLEGLTYYDAQVRARCSATSLSDWSETLTFKSGLAIPFTLSYADEGQFPSGWTTAKGALGEELTEEENGWYYQRGWYGAGFMLYESTETAVNDWMISPILDFGDGSYNFNVTLNFVQNGYGSDDSEMLRFVLIREGQTPTEADVLKTFGRNDFPEEYNDGTFDVRLEGVSGTGRLAMLMTTTTGTPSGFELTDFSVDFTCKNDVTDFQIESFDETSAKVKWTSEADKWYVFHRIEGETLKNYTEITTPEYEMTGLKPHTTYEIGITKACAENDTAKVVIYEVTTSGDVCDMPTNIVATPKKYEATLTWDAEASTYNVRYRESGAEEWITEVATETSITLKNLKDNTEYEYQIQSQCSKLDWDVSDFTEITTFTTLEETLFPPTNIAVEPTHKNATVTWEGETDRYAIDYRLATADVNDWTTVAVEGKEYLIEGLTAKTAYKLRMRSLEGDDESLNSEVVDFTTLDIPECVTPTDLTVAAITDNSATLSWTADEKNLSWNVRYRETEALEWTERLNLTETTFIVTELKSNTAYLWRVQATCEDDITSKWAAQQRFTTETTGIDAVGISDLSVFVNENMLNVVNPQHGLIHDICIYNTAGQLVKRYELSTTDNVFIRLNNVRGNVIVKVNGTTEQKTVKVSVK